MKIRLLLSALMISLVVSPLVRADGDKDTELGKEMHAMGKAFRQLKKQAEDPAQNAASLELVAQMQKAAATSVTLIPEKAASVPEADRAAFVAAYKEKMETMTSTLGKLADALKAGDNAAATKLIGEVGGMQRAGHKEFRASKD